MIPSFSLSSPELADFIFNAATHSLLFSLLAAAAALLFRRISPYIANGALFTTLLILIALPFLEYFSRSNLLSWWTVELTPAELAAPAIGEQELASIPPAPIETALQTPEPRSVPTLTELPNPVQQINILGTVWVFGIAIMVLRLAHSLWQMHSLRRRLSRIEDERVLGIWNNLVSQQTGNDTVTLRQLDKPCSPFAFGLLRPTVVLPKELIQQGTDQEIEDTLRHELNHISCYDLWIAALHSITVNLYWWNPLVRWLQRQFNHSREKLCDIAVVAQSGNPKAYASSLVSLAQRLNGFQSLPEGTTRMATSFSLLEERIKNIATNKIRMKTPRIRTLTWTACLAAVLVGILTLGIKATWAAPAQAQATLHASSQDTVRLEVVDDQVILTVEDSKGTDQSIRIPISDQAKAAELLDLVKRLGRTRTASTTLLGGSSASTGSRATTSAGSPERGPSRNATGTSIFGEAAPRRYNVAPQPASDNPSGLSKPSRHSSSTLARPSHSAFELQPVHPKPNPPRNFGPSSISTPRSPQRPVSSLTRPAGRASALAPAVPPSVVVPQPRPLVGIEALPKQRTTTVPQIAAAPAVAIEPRIASSTGGAVPQGNFPSVQQPKPVNPPANPFPPQASRTSRQRVASVPYADWQEQKAQLSALKEAIAVLEKRVAKFGVAEASSNQPAPSTAAGNTPPSASSKVR